MKAESDFPLYSLVSEDLQDVLVVADDIRGFFVDPGSQSFELTFLQVREINSRRTRAEDAILEVRNWRQEKIGEYFVGRVASRHANVGSEEGPVSSASFQIFGGNYCEHAGAAEIWRRWASRVALKAGEWLQWPECYQDDWLHVVQNSWFSTNHKAGRFGADETVYLDGRQVFTKPAFYCALGEAVNGPGGYFGSNLDALADCILSNYGVGRLDKIVWRNFQISHDLLDSVFLESIMHLMQEFEIDVVRAGG